MNSRLCKLEAFKLTSAWSRNLEQDRNETQRWKVLASKTEHSCLKNMLESLSKFMYYLIRKDKNWKHSESSLEGPQSSFFKNKNTNFWGKAELQRSVSTCSHIQRNWQIIIKQNWQGQWITTSFRGICGRQTGCRFVCIILRSLGRCGDTDARTRISQDSNKH